MTEIEEKLRLLNQDIKTAVNFFSNNLRDEDSIVQIYTHLDADGLTSGAILGRALYREKIPFQIRVLKQLEKTEIEKILNTAWKTKNFIIFSDFGSGQYLELTEKLRNGKELLPFIILDHHLPQEVSNKENKELIKQIHISTKPFHLNPYFYDIDGSVEISGAGMCYYFSLGLNSENSDLSSIAIIGALGDIQNQGVNKTFKGLNRYILDDARKKGLIEVVDDLNFPPLRPLNEAIAYSSDFQLPGLSNDVNKSLKFLQSLGILMENSQGLIKTISELNQKEKQKLTSAIIEYTSMKLDIEPSEIINHLIVNKYILLSESEDSNLRDMNEFSNLLNSCGRTNNASLGIAIAMGDREEALKKAQENLKEYKKSLMKALHWLKEENKIQHKEFLQYFYGENMINETIVGTIASMLIFDKGEEIDINKPIFGFAQRNEENVFKVSGRASKELVEKGVNLSEVIRKACEKSNLNVLGGGHPPAAGTKIPIDKAETFLNYCNQIIKNQLFSK